jgi:hypothetical protein
MEPVTLENKGKEGVFTILVYSPAYTYALPV